MTFLCPVVSVVSVHTIDNLQVEVSEDAFGTYKSGPLSVLVKYSSGNLLVRLASPEGKYVCCAVCVCVRVCVFVCGCACVGVGVRVWVHACVWVCMHRFVKLARANVKHTLALQTVVGYGR